MAGALGGATMAVATGYILQSTGQNYSIIFTIAGTLYLIALLVIHLLAPNLEPVADIEQASTSALSVGAFIGFGFIGLIFGSFAGWCVGLLSHVSGQRLFEYMMIGAGIGIVAGIIASLLFSHKIRVLNPR